MDRKTQDVYNFAKMKHDKTGAVRKYSGLPYFTHPDSVYKIAVAYGLNKNQQRVALLHDTVEDTDTSMEELADNYGPVVSELVSELTNDNDSIDKVGKTAYMSDRLVNMSSDALDVKLCDILYNSCDFPSRDQRLRINKNINYLMKNRRLTPTQKELCYSIIGENTVVNISRLQEMTASQLRGNISGITLKHWEIRQGERNAIGCLDATWTNKFLKDFLVLKLSSSATFTQGKDYIQEVLFNKPKKYLEKYFAAKAWPEKKKALLELFKNCDVKVHSTAPDFLYQGAWEDLDSKHLAIYKFKGPKGTGVWRQRHADSGGLTNPKIRVTKHLYDVLTSIIAGSDDFYKHVMMLLDKLPNKPVKKEETAAAEITDNEDEALSTT